MAPPRKQPDELPKTPSLGFAVTPETFDLLAELQRRVREAGHAKPSQSTLVSALIHAAPQDGRQLELDYLAPFRQSDPSVDA
jgi:hypothetical protein